MNFYYPDVLCPKCGGTHIETIFIRETQRYDSRNGELIVQEEEHLRRICDRCKYVWKEIPLDQEEN